MNSTCLILVPVVTTGCTTVNKTVYTLQPVVPTLLCQPVAKCKRYFIAYSHCIRAKNGAQNRETQLANFGDLSLLDP